MLNQVIIQGRLTKDPEVRYTKNQTPVASFSIANERDVKSGDNRKTDFYNVTAWRGNAEFVQKYFHKGDMCFIAGRLQTDEYEDQNGNKRKVFEIVAEKFYFGASKKQTFTELEDDGEGLPF